MNKAESLRKLCTTTQRIYEQETTNWIAYFLGESVRYSISHEITISRLKQKKKESGRRMVAYYQLQHPSTEPCTSKRDERSRRRKRHRVCRLISLPYLGLPRIIWRASAIFQRSSRFLAAVFRLRGRRGRPKDDDDVSRSPANAGETVLDSCLCKTPLLSELMEYRAVSWNLLRWTY